tara:strand:+ start:472 stop:621 length:150 start_codon:yes stop_codon:yes gene_type:complete
MNEKIALILEKSDLFWRVKNKWSDFLALESKILKIDHLGVHSVNIVVLS